MYYMRNWEKLSFLQSNFTLMIFGYSKIFAFLEALSQYHARYVIIPFAKS